MVKASNKMVQYQYDVTLQQVGVMLESIFHHKTETCCKKFSIL